MTNLANLTTKSYIADIGFLADFLFKLDLIEKNILLFFELLKTWFFIQFSFKLNKV